MPTAREDLVAGFVNDKLNANTGSALSGTSFYDNNEEYCFPPDLGINENNNPGQFQLYQNHPNQFNPVRIIKYYLPKTA